MNCKNKSKLILCCLTAAACLFFAGCKKPSFETLPETTPAATPSSVPAPPDAAGIDMDTAKKLAVAYAGLSSSDVTFTKADASYIQEPATYTVSFVTDTHQYLCELSSEDGTVMRYSMKPLAVAGQEQEPATTDVITLAQARDVALSHAGFTASEVTLTKEKLDSGDGIVEYEIEFVTATDRYEYEISPKNGLILGYSVKPLQEAVTEPSSSMLTTQEARAAALAHAGLSASGVIFSRTELDYHNGRAEYEIKFATAASRYEYDISADTGEVLEYSIHPVTVTVSVSPAGTLTEEAAKSAALTHAGLSVSEVTFIKTELEYNDGRVEYEIEFITDTRKYEYEISAGDGTVLEYSLEPLEAAVPAPPSQTATTVTAEKAKSIALAHAGLSASEVIFIKTEQDYDNGRTEYDIEFTTDTCEYEYTISADTGKILEYSLELIKRTLQGLQSHAITMEEAKNAALTHAGLSASEVTFTKAELEYEDSGAEYELEFVTENCSYEYDISAANGKVLSCSAEVR